MNDGGYILFETAIGACGLAWRETGIVGAQLPEADPARMHPRLAQRFEGLTAADPPPPIAAAIASIQRLLDGAPEDLSGLRLDMTGIADFRRRVYEQARLIPAGETRTYGEIARALGDVAYSREVGQALGKNPFPIIVPCHRVLAANGRTGGFSAPGGVTTKMRMLSIERARTSTTPDLFDDLPLMAPPKRS